MMGRRREPWFGPGRPEGQEMGKNEKWEYWRDRWETGEVGKKREKKKNE